ncbi:hypothetical protein Ciccas_012594 [Cichlidogyrus casuarinus]|uniref:Pyrophosphatase n=1 Tax=Cichlidogyrus casuarinus TaxID=1844966 RepID=A0ABD2PPB4_9PLAT
MGLQNRVEKIVDDYRLRIKEGGQFNLLTFTDEQHTKTKITYKCLQKDFDDLKKFQESTDKDEVVDAYANIIDDMLIALVAGTIFESEARELWSTALNGIEKNDLPRRRKPLK